MTRKNMTSVVMKQTLRGRTSPSVVARGASAAPHSSKRPRPSATTSTTGGGSLSPRTFVLTHGGGTLSIFIMKCTLGGMLLLVMMQGTMWVVSSTSATFSTSNNGATSRSHDLTSALRGGEAAKKKFDGQRDATLQQMRRLFAEKSVSKSRLHPLCQLLPTGSSAQQLWIHHVGSILAASQHPEDTDFFFETWTKRLLSEISPPLLEESALPHANLFADGKASDATLDIMAGILDVVYRKLMQPETAPPLRIAVLGGSHTEGTSCAEVSLTLPEGGGSPSSSSAASLSTLVANPMFCAWPFRLESFLNTLAGFPLVEIVNLAEDGTDTGFMTPLIQNGIYPPPLMPYGPDIIFHAYRQNDYFADSSAELQVTIQRELESLLQGRSASHPCRVRPPLVIHLDDTTATTVIEDLITIQADTAVTRAVEADRQVEPGSMAAHMALTWVTAFNLMDLSSKYCTSKHDNSKRTVAADMSKLADATQCQDPTTRSASSSPSPTCAFCFFASPLGTVRTTMELQHYIKGFVVHNEGWQVLADMSTGWSRKIGLVAMQPNANILFRVARIDRPVRSLHIMTLQSNGEEWKGSLARFRLAVMTPPASGNTNSFDVSRELARQAGAPPQPTAETRFDVRGYHDSTKHTTYHFTVDMTQYEAPVGSDLMLSVELVEGSRFKILGLMLCS